MERPQATFITGLAGGEIEKEGSILPGMAVGLAHKPVSDNSHVEIRQARDSCSSRAAEELPISLEVRKVLGVFQCEVLEIAEPARIGTQTLSHGFD